MKLAGMTVSLQLSDRGSEVFRLADVHPESALGIVVEEEDRRGIWVHIEREGREYFLLVRWEHIHSVEIPIAGARTKGLKP